MYTARTRTVTVVTTAAGGEVLSEQLIEDSVYFFTKK